MINFKEKFDFLSVVFNLQNEIWPQSIILWPSQKSPFSHQTFLDVNGLILMLKLETLSELKTSLWFKRNIWGCEDDIQKIKICTVAAELIF